MVSEPPWWGRTSRVLLEYPCGRYCWVGGPLSGMSRVVYPLYCVRCDFPSCLY